MAKQKIITFVPIIALATVIAVLLRLNGSAEMGCLLSRKYSRQSKTMPSGLPEFILVTGLKPVHMAKFPARLPTSGLEKPRSREPS